MGSPPHTWGILINDFDKFSLCRITPTYMGNTFVRLVGILMVKDHPHIHGEYQTDVAPSDNNQGSPPHTWGIPDEYEIRKDGDRITPTYMGNTSAVWPDCLAIWDHPHIHGEYQKIIYLKISIIGSPPHTWGIRNYKQTQVVLDRITPTYMGNTLHGYVSRR